MRSESRSCIEYLMLTNNILDSNFNLTNKSNLIDRLLHDLMRLFDHLAVALLFGPPCMLFKRKN